MPASLSMYAVVMKLARTCTHRCCHIRTCIHTSMQLCRYSYSHMGAIMPGRTSTRMFVHISCRMNPCDDNPEHDLSCSDMQLSYNGSQHHWDTVAHTHASSPSIKPSHLLRSRLCMLHLSSGCVVFRKVLRTISWLIAGSKHFVVVSLLSIKLWHLCVSTCITATQTCVCKCILQVLNGLTSCAEILWIWQMACMYIK